MKASTLAVALLLPLLASCGPTVSWKAKASAPALHPLCCPQLLPAGSQPPAGGILLGTMKLGDTGFTIRCAREQGLERVRQKACKVGADVVRVLRVSGNMVSTCDYVTAELYRLADRPQPEEALPSRVEDGTALCADSHSLRPRDETGNAPLRTPGRAEVVKE